MNPKPIDPSAMADSPLTGGGPPDSNAEGSSLYTCSQCHRWLPRTEFYLNNSKRGVRAACKTCLSAKSHARRRRPEVKLREANYQRNWRKNNPEKYRAQTHRFYWANRPKLLESMKRWRQANPEKKRKATENWAKNNAERCRASARQYRASNRERLNARCTEWKRRWRKKHPEKFRAYNKAWAEAHPDRVKENARRNSNSESHKRARRKWALANPDIRRANVLLRRGRLRANLVANNVTAPNIAARWSMFGNRCYICGAPAVASDHVVALARGGPHCLSNLRPICKPCNLAKSRIPLHEFLTKKGISLWKQPIPRLP